MLACGDSLFVIRALAFVLGTSWVIGAWFLVHVSVELGELAGEAAGEDREAAPGLGVEVLVVEVERGGVALALPLVAAPEAEEPLDPDVQLRRPCTGGTAAA